MKNFLISNWFQLMLGSSLVMGSAGFLIYSTNSATAANSAGNASVPLNEDGTITVRLSKDQMEELKNAVSTSNANSGSKKEESSGVQNVRIVGYVKDYSVYGLSYGYDLNSRGIPVYLTPN